MELFAKESKQLAALCAAHHVIRLEVFGSVATGEANESSDIDFLVEFDSTVDSNRFDNFFAFREALTALLGHPVDLVEPGGLRNPYFINSVNESRKVVYDAP